MAPATATILLGRTALLAALTFLDLNGHPIESPTPLLATMTLETASDRLDKHKIARRLRDLAINRTEKDHGRRESC